MKNITSQFETEIPKTSETAKRDGIREADIFTQELREEQESKSALAAGIRSRSQMARLPFAKIRGIVCFRIQNPKQKQLHTPSKSSIRNAKNRKSLSWIEIEDCHSLTAIACHRLGIDESGFPTFEQWKAIFRFVRSNLGIDRKSKRDQNVEILSMDPALLATIEVSEILSTPEEIETGRKKLAPMVRAMHRALVASFQADTSRKRKSRFIQEIRFLRSLSARKGGNIERAMPFAKGASESCFRKRFFDFRKYLERGEREIERRANALPSGEFKSFACL